MAYQRVKTYDSDDTGISDATTEFTNDEAHNRQQARRLNTILQLFLALVSVVTITLLTLNLLTLRASLRKQEKLDGQHSNRLVGTLPLTYGHDRRFMSLDPQYDHLWDAWSADAQIMVPGDLPGEGLLQGAYSMFHQMHCLSSFRRAIQSARAGEDPGYDYLDNGHWPHCFDYMRQTILCWADNTIETAAVFNGTRNTFIDGSNTVRQCRSPEKMYQRMRLDEKAVEKANSEDGLDHEQDHHHHHEQGVGIDSLNLTRDLG